MLEIFASLSVGLHQIEWAGFEVYAVKSPWADVLIAKQGGQVIHYQPKGHEKVFWCLNNPAKGKAIRGGVPICWPWFGPHATDSTRPNHGVARMALWQLVPQSFYLDDSVLLLQLEPKSSVYDSCAPKLILEVTKQSISLDLQTQSLSEKAQPLTQALHSYFYVSDSRTVEVEGLKGLSYFDKLEQGAEKKQSQSLKNISAIDNIYQHAGAVTLIDQALSRKILIEKSSSGSTVVWNPGANSSFDDIGEQNKHFLCIEAANTFHEALCLEPKSVFTLSQKVTVQHLIEE